MTDSLGVPGAATGLRGRIVRTIGATEPDVTGALAMGILPSGRVDRGYRTRSIGRNSSLGQSRLSTSPREPEAPGIDAGVCPSIARTPAFWPFFPSAPLYGLGMLGEEFGEERLFPMDRRIAKEADDTTLASWNSQPHTWLHPPGLGEYGVRGN